MTRAVALSFTELSQCSRYGAHDATRAVALSFTGAEGRSAVPAMMRVMALRDYAAWHDEYDRASTSLHLRLLVVQDLIAAALDELPPGPVRVISMCAGQGRDLIGVACRHRRGEDPASASWWRPTLRNAAVARADIARAGLGGLTVIEGDAGQSAVYAQGRTRQDPVLACGVFGNVSHGDIQRTVRFLPALCARDGWVIWTRQPKPDGILPVIQGWFEEAGFSPRALVVPEPNLFGVGAARLAAAPRPFCSGQPLFAFVQ